MWSVRKIAGLLAAKDIHVGKYLHGMCNLHMYAGRWFEAVESWPEKTGHLDGYLYTVYIMINRNKI